MKFCTTVAVTMGLPLSTVPRIAEGMSPPRKAPARDLAFRPGVHRLCIESLLRTQHPTLEHLIFDLISLEYSHTLNAGAGHQAEETWDRAVEQHKGRFILVVDGAIPVKDGGVYCQIAGRPVLDILKETAPLGRGGHLHRLLRRLGRCRRRCAQSHRSDSGT
jgi:hydrogenase small subunit